MSESQPTVDELSDAIQLACQPQNTYRIVAGRNQVLAMPRDWVLENFERAAIASLDLSDYWEYRRLLELAELLSTGLVQRLVPLGLSSNDPDDREAAEDFQKKRVL